ncbi:ABC transporter substrate-binding protein [Acidisoma cellulosilytica]|uniref:ABC transporter substrate-binding protein n=1 Tax=Acidisoma cellulosilyticum TaxID=2802395 RepID=A0A964E4Y2_9PROT|nr:ABC transporter substrate-binding protein [Acidisoma cellulosilyticum]MCB8882120.1 ABC transporter substrate-binding protein [Acidisoma cellulosilyticum]
MADETEAREDNRRAARKFNMVLGVAAVIALLVAAYRVLPPSQITIATGPVGGSYYQDAESYHATLQHVGIKVHLHPVPNSLDIAKDVDDRQDGISIGFVAQSLDPEEYRHTLSLGAIEQQPLFIFTATSLGAIEPAALQGRLIVMPPLRSASSEAALALLAQYGVTPANSRIVHMPIADAVADLDQGKADAGFFMLDPQDGFIERLAHDPGLQLMNLRDSATIARLNPSLHAITLLRGIFDLKGGIPPEDVHMMAANITVVANKHVSQAILYLLLQAMANAHRDASLINDAGTYPNLVNIALPPHPVALDFEKNGLPWAYQNLPRWMASLVNSYLIIGLVFVVLVELWSSILYFMELIDFLYVHFWLRVLLRIEQRVKRGHVLRPSDIRFIERAERALIKSDRRRRSEDLIERIRSTYK